MPIHSAVSRARLALLATFATLATLAGRRVRGMGLLRQAVPSAAITSGAIVSVATGAIALGAMTGVASVASAQFHEPNPEAAKAFAEMVKAYRGYSDLKCVSSVRVEAADGKAVGGGEPVKAEMLIGRIDNGRHVVVRLRGFTCWIGDGFLSVIHESNPHAYFRAPDGGAPYYALLSAFLDLPFPELALAFGEESPEDVVMQLHTKAPWMRPTRVERISGADAAAERVRVHLTSDHETATLDLDPMTQLPKEMTVSITGGALVPSGSTLIYRHQFEHELPAEAIGAELLRFDPGTRQRSDALAALPRRAPAHEQRGAPRDDVPHELVGKPAPAIVVPLLDGGTFDLSKSRGRVVVLDFWATWCGPCIAAMPHLHRAAADFKGANAPVEFVTVNTFERFDKAERDERVRRFWRDRKFTLPVAMDLDGQLSREYSVPAIPMTVVIRADGVVHAVHVGFSKERLLQDVADAIAALEQAVE